MTDNDASDAELLRRYAGGEVGAFEQLYRRHEMRIWRYLHRNVRSHALAEELTQEVWFAVARSAARYEPTARFTTWLFTIAHHRMLDAMRTARRQVSLDELGEGAETLLMQQGEPGEGGPYALAAASEQAAALRQALGQLPAEQRDALLLQMEGELSVEDIAALTGSSFETTKSRLRYARTRLRALLGACV